MTPEEKAFEETKARALAVAKARGVWGLTKLYIKLLTMEARHIFSLRRLRLLITLGYCRARLAVLAWRLRP